MCQAFVFRCIFVLATVFIAAASAAAQPEPVAGSGTPAEGHAEEVKLGELVLPKAPNGWYTSAEMDHALQAASTLGQPLAIIQTDLTTTCPKCKVQTQAWMGARELGAFIRVVVSITDAERPMLLNRLEQQAGERAGRFIPRLFFGTPAGEFLGVVPTGAERVQFLQTIGAALQQFGGIMPPDQMMALWKKLAQARQFWSEGKFTPALRAYQDIKRAEGINSKLTIFEELKRDEPNIVEKGGAELAAVHEFLAAGDQRKARTELANIRRQYHGFQPAEDARELQEAKPNEAAAHAPDAETDASNGLRPWTDATGKHQIEAKLVAVKDGWVRLERPSGELLSIPIAKLSQFDQEYVARSQRE